MSTRGFHFLQTSSRVGCHTRWVVVHVKEPPLKRKQHKNSDNKKKRKMSKHRRDRRYHNKSRLQQKRGVRFY